MEMVQQVAPLTNSVLLLGSRGYRQGSDRQYDSFRDFPARTGLSSKSTADQFRKASYTGNGLGQEKGGFTWRAATDERLGDWSGLTAKLHLSGRDW